MGYWFDRPPMEPVAKLGSSRGYGHTIGPSQRDLQRWVGGAPLTPGLIRDLRVYEEKGYLVIEGRSIPGVRGLSWSVRFSQYGHPDRYGMAFGSSAEDACDRACEMIREEEAERLLYAALPGLA